MFSRDFLMEAILFVLEKNDVTVLDINKLFNEVHKLINYSPDEDILKFQFINYLNYLKNEKIIMVNNKQVILKKVNDDMNIFKIDDDISIRTIVDSIDIKKILVDLKNNSNKYYTKISQKQIFSYLIEII